MTRLPDPALQVGNGNVHDVSLGCRAPFSRRTVSTASSKWPPWDFGVVHLPQGVGRSNSAASVSYVQVGTPLSRKSGSLVRMSEPVARASATVGHHSHRAPASVRPLHSSRRGRQARRAGDPALAPTPRSACRRRQPASRRQRLPEVEPVAELVLVILVSVRKRSTAWPRRSRARAVCSWSAGTGKYRLITRPWRVTARGSLPGRYSRCARGTL